MFAATYSLVAEGIAMSPARLVVGMMIGLVGILAARTFVVERQHVGVANFSELDARNMTRKLEA
jgi:hypothetical protein